MRPTKILHVMNSAAGGAALSTLGLMTHLRRRGIASAAVCHAVGTSEERQAILEATNGETVFAVLYSWNRKFRSPWHERPIKELKQGVRTGWARRSARHVTAHARSVGADLIHTNTILNPEGGLAAAALGLPHVWHLRELVGPRAWFRLPLEGEALGRFLAARCSMLVANSESSAAAVRKGLPAGLLAVVPNGIDLSRFEALPPAARTDKIVVGMVANLASHVKKHRLFIEAAAHVAPSLNAEFRIYGAAPSNPFDSPEPYVRDLCGRIDALGLRDRMVFAGFDPDPARIMAGLDILVHPSDLESFGRIIVEAMAASRPVVSVRGGGAAEIVQDGITGLLAPPDDAVSLGAHIETLLRDGVRRREMGERGRQRAVECYSLDAHVSRMLAVYETCMDRPVAA